MAPVAPVRGRAAFAALARSPERARSGPVQIRRSGDEMPPRVAYAVGRSAGTAVARNRIRRRLRAVVAELVRDGELAQGSYLVSADRDALTCDFATLRAHVRTAAAVGAG